MSNVTVVGNGVSGWACAKRLAEGGASVVLVGPGLPHDRPPLSKRALASGRIPWSATAEELVERGIVHVDGHARAVDLDAHALTIERRGADELEHREFERLVWATGFAFPHPPIDDLRGDRVHQNHEAIGTLALHRRLAGRPRRVAVVGAGLVGTETAATAAALGHSVTLLDMMARPLHRLPLVAADAAATTLRDLGVTFVGGCQITSIGHAGSLSTIRTRAHGAFECDTLVVAAGGASTVPSGLGGPTPPLIDVDETLRVVGRDDVWACGDCIAFPHPRWGRISIPHWDHALHSGRHVADAILGSADAYVREPYWFSDIGPLRMQLVGNADAVEEWRDEAGLTVGREPDGRVAAVLLINAPTRLIEARERVAEALTANV